LPKTTLRLSDSEGKVLSILFEKLEEIVTLEIKEGKKQDVLNILTPLSELAKKRRSPFS
jgi:hypothetical protein